VLSASRLRFLSCYTAFLASTTTTLRSRPHRAVYAQAFSQSSLSPLSKFRGTAVTSGSCSGSGSFPLALSSSNNNPAVNGEGRSEEGRTGWNHNKPRDESKFWNQTPESKEENLDPKRRKFQTGWLHNTKSREEIEKKKKQQNLAAATRGGGGSDSSGSSSTLFPARRMLELAMKQSARNHRIVHPVAFHACGDEAGVIAVSEHKITVPLSYDDDDTEKTTKKTIDVFFKIAEKVQSESHRAWLVSLNELSPQKRAAAYVENAGMKMADRMILYLQGGPGFGAPTPIVSLGFSKDGSWAGHAMSMGTYDRVVLMDQRGTGKSTTMTKQSLEKLFPDLFLLDSEQPPSSSSLEDFRYSKPEVYAKVKSAVDETVQYMSQFRADNIVQDAEVIRDALLLPAADESAVRPWGACLGQSFGGFCIMTYLSKVDNPPKIALLTGGIGPALFQAYDVYSSLWHRVKERSLLYYDMYPGDIVLVKKIVRRLEHEPQPLPSGGTLTARRLLQLGIALGGSPSSFASLHNLFQSAFLQGTEDDELPEFNRAFLKEIEMDQSYDDCPIYFWLHESIYADGPDFSPTQWAAQRSYDAIVAQDPSFDYRKTCALDSEEPVILFGEMTFPWMVEDFGELKGVGLSQVANEIANKADWPRLYDPAHMRAILESGKTKAAAAVYVDDMYVDFDCCRKLTTRGGPLEKVKVWISNDYQHSGLRDDGANIFKKIHGMATGKIRTPS